MEMGTRSYERNKIENKLAKKSVWAQTGENKWKNQLKCKITGQPVFHPCPSTQKMWNWNSWTLFELPIIDNYNRSCSVEINLPGAHDDPTPRKIFELAEELVTGCMKKAALMPTAGPRGEKRMATFRTTADSTAFARLVRTWRTEEMNSGTGAKQFHSVFVSYCRRSFD